MRDISDASQNMDSQKTRPRTRTTEYMVPVKLVIARKEPLHMNHNGKMPEKDTGANANS